MTYPDWPTIRNSIAARNRNYPMIAADTPTFLGQPLVGSPDELADVDVVILGVPYIAGWEEYAGMSKADWLAALKGVRQQSIRYQGYIQDFGLNIFDHVKVADLGDLPIPTEILNRPTPQNILSAARMVEDTVGQIVESGAIPIVIGQNSPCSSYSVAKPIAERTPGGVGVIKLDTHWDVKDVDWLTSDDRIAGSGNWVRQMYRWHPNMAVENLVEIGERGALEKREWVEEFVGRGAHFYPMWKIRTELTTNELCEGLSAAYDGSDAVFVHFDMDVLGGAGAGPGDAYGELAEPMGMTDYEAIRIAHEIGKRGLSAASFVAIPPGSALMYRTIVYMIQYLIAGLCLNDNTQRHKAPKREL